MLLRGRHAGRGQLPDLGRLGAGGDPPERRGILVVVLDHGLHVGPVEVGAGALRELIDRLLLNGVQGHIGREAALERERGPLPDHVPVVGDHLAAELLHRIVGRALRRQRTRADLERVHAGGLTDVGAVRGGLSRRLTRGRRSTGRGRRRGRGRRGGGPRRSRRRSAPGVIRGVLRRLPLQQARGRNGQDQRQSGSGGHESACRVGRMHAHTLNSSGVCDHPVTSHR